ncbi:MAG: helix-turn-helix transcriptional regulator [Thermosipho sp. (in: Bacteria)]|nr:helix-turn-helix transcriptional regulator [Thermosipho sp. (in: thermotogales)]
MINRLKFFRSKFNLTQEELAKKVGVSRQTINYIENGKYNPSVVLALKLAKVFGCKVEDIFKIEECDENEKISMDN